MKRTFFTHIYLLILVGIAVAMGCCGRHGTARRGMDRAERLMAVSPDSAPAALAALESITPKMLGGSGEKARYALLKSMALDKNYIDKKDFSVLQPAIEYYLTKDKGTADDKLRTLYYQGCIYLNRNDNDSAMQSFMRGRDLGSQVKDSLTLANLMVAQGTILYRITKLDDHVKINLDASKLYSKLGRTDYEVSCLANVLYIGIITDNRKLADSVMNVMSMRVKSNRDLNSAIAPYILSYTINFGSEREIAALLGHYSPNDSISDMDKVEIARAYCKLGNPALAKKYIESVDSHSDFRKTLKYLSVKPYILEANGDYADAFAAYQDYSNTKDSINLDIFSHDLAFAEQRHEAEKENILKMQKKDRIIWISLSFLSVVLLVAVILSLRYKNIRTKNKLNEEKNARLELEQENLSHKVEDMKREMCSLKEILEKEDNLSEPVETAIKTRVEILNNLFATLIVNKDLTPEIYKTLNEQLVKDRKEFMNTTRLAFKASHPKFIAFFEEHGLTEDEINYCCLYAIGLRGKEAGEYMQMRRHYQIGFEIRRKLGFEAQKPNLGIFIRKLMKER